MRTKQTSYAQQRHRKTFYLARCDPERWEQEKEASLLESLREARERTSAAEKEAKTNKKLLKQSQQQASIIIVREDELRASVQFRRPPVSSTSYRPFIFLAQ